MLNYCELPAQSLGFGRVKVGKFCTLSTALDFLRNTREDFYTVCASGYNKLKTGLVTVFFAKLTDVFGGLGTFYTGPITKITN